MITSMGEKARFAYNAKDVGVRSLDIPTNGLVLHCPFKDVNDTHAATGQALTYTGLWNNWKCAGLDTISTRNRSESNYIDAELGPASDGTYFENIANFTDCTISFWLFDFADSNYYSYVFQPCCSGFDIWQNERGLTWYMRSAGTTDRMSYYGHNSGSVSCNLEKYVWHHVLITMSERRVVVYADNVAVAQHSLNQDYCAMNRWLFMISTFCAMRDFRIYNRPVIIEERMALWQEHSDAVNTFLNAETGANG